MTVTKKGALMKKLKCEFSWKDLINICFAICTASVDKYKY